MTSKSGITIPGTFMGIDTGEAYRKAMREPEGQRPDSGENANVPHQDLEGFIYVPSTGLYVAKERTFHGKDWFDSHKLLQQNGERMQTILEFAEFLRHLRENPSDENTKIYNDITEARSPWRAEWLDADFKVKNGELYINSDHVYGNGNLIPKNSEILDEDTLMKDKTPGISLDSWLDSPTSQGLPRDIVKEGKMHYWCPKNDNNSVAGFDAGSVGADLSCNGGPSNWYSDLGVRAVRRE